MHKPTISTNVHPMQTRVKASTFKPKALIITMILPALAIIKEAMWYIEWLDVEKEYEALLRNITGSWCLHQRIGRSNRCLLLNWNLICRLRDIRAN